MHPDSHNDPPQREENSEAPADVSRGEQEPGTSEDPMVITDHCYDEKFKTSKESKQFGVPCKAQIQEKLCKNHIKSYYILITHSASLSNHHGDIIL